MLHDLFIPKKPILTRKQPLTEFFFPFLPELLSNISGLSLPVLILWPRRVEPELQRVFRACVFSFLTELRRVTFRIAVIYFTWCRAAGDRLLVGGEGGGRGYAPPNFQLKPSTLKRTSAQLIGKGGRRRETAISGVAIRHLPSFTGFSWFLLGFTRCYWILLGFKWFYWSLLGFTGFYGDQRSFTGFYSKILGFNRVVWNVTRFYWV